ncbi:ImpB/MucB/SamB family protein [Streptococcus sp. oral taxon 056 str. F0418]|uniref:hypothetical protein n=1 Tax=Streptococcus sp. oral taxon 056 TaxID=712620 RepID=UPI000218103A|nr:hypothetical protein [Streptococcus sp. oral taxon 056]EGP66571.1 ImpB/MucB/SamB family protein [Streptococcus sp. oral taxon 056 str. F0418]
MVLFDYSREPHSDIAFVDMKSFYASLLKGSALTIARSKLTGGHSAGGLEGLS